VCVCVCVCVCVLGQYMKTCGSAVTCRIGRGVVAIR
jgi:hypothetical protein